LDDFVQVQTILWNRVDRHLREKLNVGLGGVSILQVISEVENCRPVDVTTTMDMTTGGVSQALDRMEQRGWCRRASNPGDRRSSIVVLTPEGARILTESRATIELLLSTTLAATISATDLSDLVRLTAQLRRAFRERA
jgi:DNA-binding MarR family transcriptional regulator